MPFQAEKRSNKLQKENLELYVDAMEGKLIKKQSIYTYLLLSQLKNLGLLKFYPIFVYRDATSYFFLKIVLPQITQKITINRVYADPPH